MTPHNIILIAVIGLAAFIGWRLGAVKIAIMLAAPLAAGALAPTAYSLVVSRIALFAGDTVTGPRVAVFASWILALAAIYIIAAIITKIADMIMLGAINRGLGAVVFAAAALWISSFAVRRLPSAAEGIKKSFASSRILQNINVFDKK
ncbi:MAG: CvpA family protein [Endomicrobiia bacterium]|nr:CvpA family protein [Endomicrobiia bacterium]